MRIIGGRHSGRKITGPKNDSIRPTGDRVRESLFSILGDIEETIVVDAFAGTGALGCEALSRGAKHVTFFDTSKKAIELIKQNVTDLGEDSKTTIVFGSIEKQGARIGEPPHLVFLDPPYDAVDLYSITLEKLAPSLAPDALCILEHHSDVEPALPEGFESEDVRGYGDTTITFVRWSGANA